MVDRSRTLRSASRRQRRYEIHQADGRRRVLSLRELDALLNGRTTPLISGPAFLAADEAFPTGDHDTPVDWPS